tara:strand:+ start:68703 stop:69164 length:462 start_codon:yes stop_codon:yes gene_type:complete
MDLRKPLSWIANGFGSGLSPLAPGTVGSLFAFLIFFIVQDQVSLYFWLITIAVSFYLGLFIYPSTTSGVSEDPKEFVWDEFVGMWTACISFFFISPTVFSIILTFLLFRFFDISKFGLVGFFDKRSGAVNVMLDDLVAGIFTFVIVYIIFIFV